MVGVTAFTASAIQISSVLVATDFSHASEKPMRHALAISRHYGAQIYLMHVVSSLGFTLAGPDSVAAASGLAWKDMREFERRLVESGKLAGLRHHVIVSDGDVWTEVEKIISQEHIDVVVLGTHSRKGLVRLVLGSVAERIFRHASCLVLTVGPNSPSDADLENTGIIRPLLFPTDFGEASLRALPYAISFANQRRSKLVLLHMLSLAEKLEDNRWRTPADIAQLEEDEQAATRRRLKGLIGHTPAPGFASEFTAEFGEPAEGILRAAETLNAEGIIMGLNRRSHIEMISHLPWSTAYEVVCRAVCPVLTVRN